MIVGRPSGPPRPLSGFQALTVAPNRELLGFDKVSTRVLRDVSFTIHSGEICGLAGLTGSGVKDVPELLLGTIRQESGTIRIHGEVMRGLSPRRLLDREVAVLPADRRH